MELDKIQEKFFYPMVWHNVFRTKASLKRAFEFFMSHGGSDTEAIRRTESTEDKMFRWSKYLIDTEMIGRMFENKSELNKFIGKLLRDETFDALFPEKCSRFHVFRSKKDGTWHIEEQMDLFKDMAKAIMDSDE